MQARNTQTDKNKSSGPVSLYRHRPASVLLPPPANPPRTPRALGHQCTPARGPPRLARRSLVAERLNLELGSSALAREPLGSALVARDVDGSESARRRRRAAREGRSVALGGVVWGKALPCLAYRARRSEPTARVRGARGGWAVSDGRAGSGPGDAPPRRRGPPSPPPVSPARHTCGTQLQFLALETSRAARPRAAPRHLRMSGWAGREEIMKQAAAAHPTPSPPSPHLHQTYPHDPPSTAPVGV